MMTKFNKKDYWLTQDFQVKTFKATKCNEVSDDISRMQELQVKESINLELLGDCISVSNSIHGTNSAKGSAYYLANGEYEDGSSTTTPGKDKYGLPLLALKPIETKLEFVFSGEVGAGGRPLKKGNPYLEIDLIDPTDPILFEGEI